MQRIQSLDKVSRYTVYGIGTYVLVCFANTLRPKAPAHTSTPIKEAPVAAAKVKPAPAPTLKAQSVPVATSVSAVTASALPGAASVGLIGKVDSLEKRVSAIERILQ